MTQPTGHHRASWTNGSPASAGGIVQADAEGFSNVQGHHILWQFSNNVDGAYVMAVLRDGAWVSLEMDLGSADHRSAFMRGEAPAGIAPLAS